MKVQAKWNKELGPRAWLLQRKLKVFATEAERKALNAAHFGICGRLFGML
jgi:hypothetical protein